MASVMINKIIVMRGGVIFWGERHAVSKSMGVINKREVSGEFRYIMVKKERAKEKGFNEIF